MTPKIETILHVAMIKNKHTHSHSNSRRNTDKTDSRARSEILQAAAELFMQFGYAATSVDAITASIGTTKGQFYHYYDTKADLFFDIQTLAMTNLLKAVKPIALVQQPIIKRLEAMALCHAKILLADLPVMKVAVQGLERHLFSGTGSMRRLRAVIKLRDEYEQIFTEVIDEGIRQGLVIDLPAKLLTKAFFGTMNWATIWYSQRRLQVPEATGEIAQILAGCALRGVSRFNGL
jgi:AcrR family transcriptional regulator